MKEKDYKNEFLSHAYDIKEDYESNNKGIIPLKFGLCSTCEHFCYATYQYGKELAFCNYTDAMGKWPTGVEPILTCSKYYKNGGISLTEMASMATYINADKKDKIGFHK